MDFRKTAKHKMKCAEIKQMVYENHLLSMSKWLAAVQFANSLDKHLPL